MDFKMFVIVIQVVFIIGMYFQVRRMQLELVAEVARRREQREQSVIATVDPAGRIPMSVAPELSIAIDRYLWRNWWHGSGPQRGDHLYCGGSPITYLGDQHHDEVGELIQAHNAVVEELFEALANTSKSPISEYPDKVAFAEHELPIDQFIDDQVNKTDGDVAEAMYWVFDALNKPHGDTVRDVLLGSPNASFDRAAFKRLFHAFACRLK